MVRSALQTFFLLLMLLFVASCGDIQNEYGNFRPYFVYENHVHQNPRSAEAMTPNSGMFCAVQQQFINGAQYYVLTNSDGRSDKSILNDLDKQRRHVLGYNNGLIVGYGNLSSPPVFYAYDLECPNCFDPQALPMKSKPLQLLAGGIAVCRVCNRRYNLNNSGVIIQGERSRKLTRYPAQTTGPYGILVVN